jgi:uncharacterized protein YdhG (YjbR/CyaY superfamily)
MKTYKTIDEYMKGETGDIKAKLEEMLALSRKLVPKGEEDICYGMPTIRLNNTNLIHFASMKGHFGFYPSPSPVKEFEKDLKKAGIDYSKGCVRFPYDKALPKGLITKMIKFRVKEVR